VQPLSLSFFSFTHILLQHNKAKKNIIRACCCGCGGGTVTREYLESVSVPPSSSSICHLKPFLVLLFILFLLIHQYQCCGINDENSGRRNINKHSNNDGFVCYRLFFLLLLLLCCEY